MTSRFELPRAVIQGMSCYEFEGKTIWKFSEQMTHVKLEMTFKLQDTPTDRPARAVEQKPKRPAKHRVRPPRPPRRPLQETQPPANTTVEMPRATIKFTPPKPVTRALPPTTTRQQPTITSPEPMEATPSASADVTFREEKPDLSQASLLQTNLVRKTQNWESTKKYDLRCVFRYPVRNGDHLKIIDAVHRTDLQTSFYVKWANTKTNTYMFFKGPTSKSYIPAWYNFFVSVMDTTVPFRHHDSARIKKLLRNLIATRDRGAIFKPEK